MTTTSGSQPNRAAGGRARAERLDPEARSAIAKTAAAARWNKEQKEAICGSPEAPLVLGDTEVECYVLDDGTRVLTQSSFLRALGRHGRPNTRRQDTEDGLPPILQGKAISPFISEELRQKAQPITFQLPGGGRASGYNAELLPAICEIYLKAKDAKVLPYQQLHVADRAYLLMRALAHVGIVALVDEATGYQEVRARNALAGILEAFVAKELQAWVRTFPDDFYAQMFRLRGLPYPTESVARPQYFGILTNNIVYDRLAPGVLKELKAKTPRNELGRHKAKLFQHLTDNIGYPKLREHLGSVVTLMKLSRDWDDFMRKLDQIHPKMNDTIPLPFDLPTDNGRGI